jgi:Na+/phosphate symporter
MFKNPASWANRGAGGLFGSIIFLALTFMGDSVSPSSATPALKLFFVVVAVISMVAWSWGTYQVWIDKRENSRSN